MARSNDTICNETFSSILNDEDYCLHRLLSAVNKHTYSVLDEISALIYIEREKRPFKRLLAGKLRIIV